MNGAEKLYATNYPKICRKQEYFKLFSHIIDREGQALKTVLVINIFLLYVVYYSLRLIYATKRYVKIANFEKVMLPKGT